MTFGLDIFETPVTVTPQQEISKTINSPRIILLKYLTFTFGERTFTVEGRAFTFGDNRGFWNSFFVAGGVLGLRGSGGAVGVFENI